MDDISKKIEAIERELQAYKNGEAKTKSYFENMKEISEWLQEIKK